jgi:hypothetical protein
MIIAFVRSQAGYQSDILIHRHLSAGHIVIQTEDRFPEKNPNAQQCSSRDQKKKLNNKQKLTRPNVFASTHP